MTGECGGSVFNFFAKPLYSFPQWLYQFKFPPAEPECVLFSAFLYILTRVKGNLTAALIFISLVFSEVKHFFMHFACKYHPWKNVCSGTLPIL